MSPHLRARKIMSVAVDAPHSATHLRVEDDPIRGVHPLAGHSSRRTGPGGAAVLAAEEADIGISNELAFRIERVEVNSVARGDIETEAGPARVIDSARIQRCPCGATVGGPHG